jgi:hypothetical protein
MTHNIRVDDWQQKMYTKTYSSVMQYYSNHQKVCVGFAKIVPIPAWADRGLKLCEAPRPCLNFHFNEVLLLFATVIFFKGLSEVVLHVSGPCLRPKTLPHMLISQNFSLENIPFKLG